MGVDRLGPGGKPKRGNESGMEDKEIERHTNEMVRRKSSGGKRPANMWNLSRRGLRPVGCKAGMV